MKFTVYVLRSKKCQKCYTGFTTNLDARLAAHNDFSKKGWTIRCRPWEILYTEVYDSKDSALLREKELKSGKGRDFIKALLVQPLQGLISAAADLGSIPSFATLQPPNREAF